MKKTEKSTEQKWDEINFGLWATIADVQEIGTAVRHMNTDLVGAILIFPGCEIVEEKFINAEGKEQTRYELKPKAQEKPIASENK